MSPQPFRTDRLLRALAVALGLLGAACGDGGAEWVPAGYVRTPAPEVGALALPAVEADGGERERTFEPAGSDLLLVYFGYTSCPDVCPTTLSDVRRALGQLGDDAARVELAMVTIDPGIDTPEVLVGYVRSFVPDAVALRTTDDDRLRAVADGFGADYGREEVDGTSEVFHTGSLYAVDAGGRIALTWPFGTTVDDLTADLAQLLEQEA